MKRSLLVVAICLLSACGSSGGDGSDSLEAQIGLDSQSQTGTSSAGGQVVFNFNIPPGSSAFQITALAESQEIELLSVTGPTGDILTTADIETTDATALQADINTFNYPTLSNGVAVGSYQATYQLTTRNGRNLSPDVKVTFTTIVKSGETIDSGELLLNVVFVGPVAESTEILNNIESAVGVMQEIYATVGISFDVQYYSFEGPEELPDPRNGDMLYLSISQAVRPGAVSLLMGSNVSNLSRNSGTQFGIPGGTPGPAFPSLRSVSVLSISAVTGGDGLFDSDDRGAFQLGDSEVRVAGEELGRLVAHYLGLQDPVTFSGSTVVSTDRIVDTESCINRIQCINESQPRGNFCFPQTVSVDGGNDKYYARRYVSPQQGELMKRGVLMR